MDSFQIVHDKSRSDIACACLTQAIRPERNHRKTDLLEFLIDRIDHPEVALKNALIHYNVGLKFDINSIKSTKKVRSLSVHSNFYYWVLKKYGPNSEITQMCFGDILESRIWVDLKLQEIPKRDIPGRLTESAFNAICSIYLEFCNENVPFKPHHLQYLQLANNEEIINPLFGVHLPIVFGLPLNYILPFNINYECSRPEIKLTDNTQNHNKRKFNEVNDNQSNTNEEWLRLLEKINCGNSDISENFKNKFKEFWGRITSSQIQLSIDNGNGEFNVAGQSTESISTKFI